MKSALLLFLGLLLTSNLFAQKKAVTESGETVILYEDGTWSYEDEDFSEDADIPVNPKAFKKSEKSTFLVKSKKASVGIWLDSKKWTFKKAVNNTDAEFEFQLKDEDLYGMLVSEKTEIPLSALRGIALENAKAAAPDIKIVKEEYRTVNGVQVLFMQLNGTTQGIKFSYYGYYFSNKNGTVQLITYSAQNLLKGYIPECEELLNGFVELD